MSITAEAFLFFIGNRFYGSLLRDERHYFRESIKEGRCIIQHTFAI